jgi:protein gp37
MGLNTKINWADNTWNPWQGCHRVSSGCDNCYMHREKLFHKQDPTIVIRSKDKTFYSPLKWNEPARVFVCSWSDFFIEEADSWRIEAWEIIRKQKHLMFIIPTKRPERILDCLPKGWDDGWPNVCLMVSTEDQEAADKRISQLRKIPAAYRGISAEPLLGPIDFNRWISDKIKCSHCGQAVSMGNLTELLYHKDIPHEPLKNESSQALNIINPPPKSKCINSIDWIIVGGESGPHARAIYPDWARQIRDDCQAAGLPFFFKQWGEWVDFFDAPIAPDNFKGQTIYYKEDHIKLYRLGKKTAGRLLDGREWNETPWDDKNEAIDVGRA